jgi:hypothetical protein
MKKLILCLIIFSSNLLYADSWISAEQAGIKACSGKKGITIVIQSAFSNDLKTGEVSFSEQSTTSASFGHECPDKLSDRAGYGDTEYVCNLVSFKEKTCQYKCDGLIDYLAACEKH